MSAEAKPQAHFIAAWEFCPRPEKRREFEEAYGPSGDWAQLFQKAEGYIRTELYRDEKKPGRYFTLDFWQSRAAFCTFKQQNSAEYRALDEKCSALTEEENFIGEYTTPEQLNEFLAMHEFPHTKVRPASPADVPAILALERSCVVAAHWPESAYCTAFDPGAPERIALVLEDNDEELRGFLIARTSDKDWELENIVVDGSSRRRGLGRMLLHTLIASASVRRASRIFLEVRESNLAARALYENCGFMLSGRRNSYYGSPPEDAILYHLQL